MQNRDFTVPYIFDTARRFSFFTRKKATRATNIDFTNESFL